MTIDIWREQHLVFERAAFEEGGLTTALMASGSFRDLQNVFVDCPLVESDDLVTWAKRNGWIVFRQLETP